MLQAANWQKLGKSDDNRLADPARALSALHATNPASFAPLIARLSHRLNRPTTLRQLPTSQWYVDRPEVVMCAANVWRASPIERIAATMAMQCAITRPVNDQVNMPTLHHLGCDATETLILERAVLPTHQKEFARTKTVLKSLVYYARLIPPREAAEFFGFYNMIGKFAAVLGPLLVAIAAAWTGSTRTAVVAVLPLLILGGLLLFFTPGHDEGTEPQP